LRALLEAHQRQQRAGMPGGRGRVLSTGLAELDALLPDGGFAPGSMIELLGADVGAGCLSLTLWLARAAAMPDSASSYLFHGDAPVPLHADASARAHAAVHRPVILLDVSSDFYPPAGVHMGLHPDRLVVVQPAHVRDALWAAEQSLRCPAVGAVVAPLEGLTDGQARRLQLAAEQGGGLALVLKRSRSAGRSFATMRLELQGLRESGIKGLREDCRAQDPFLNPLIPQSLNPCFSNRRFRITLVYIREGMPGGSCVVELPDEADFVFAPSKPGVGTVDGVVGAPGAARCVG
jgi:hypothetical protein